MGRAMCEHVLKAGFPVVVYNRTESKALPMVEQGARLAKSVAELAAQVDICCSIVGFPRDVEQVLLGPDGEPLASAADGGGSER